MINVPRSALTATLLGFLFALPADADPPRKVVQLPDPEPEPLCGPASGNYWLTSVQEVGRQAEGKVKYRVDFCAKRPLGCGSSVFLGYELNVALYHESPSPPKCGAKTKTNVEFEFDFPEDAEGAVHCSWVETPVLDRPARVRVASQTWAALQTRRKPDPCVPNVQDSKISDNQLAEKPELYARIGETRLRKKSGNKHSVNQDVHVCNRGGLAKGDINLMAEWGYTGNVKKPSASAKHPMFKTLEGLKGNECKKVTFTFTPPTGVARGFIHVDNTAMYDESTESNNVMAFDYGVVFANASTPRGPGR